MNFSSLIKNFVIGSNLTLQIVLKQIEVNLKGYGPKRLFSINVFVIDYIYFHVFSFKNQTGINVVPKTKFIEKIKFYICWLFCKSKCDFSSFIGLRNIT